MPGPLAGIRILDCTEIIAAPYASALLSDMGAEVIKVEPVEGEPWRLQAQFIPNESRTFLALNRGKKGLAINLRDERGQEIFHQLVPTADVLLLNYRPDTPARLGIDYDTLSKINPRLIYVWNTAFGRNGPHAQRPGYDIIIQAYSGLMTSMGGERNGIPTTMPTALADFASALVLAWAVTAGLYARERTGEGQLIDTSLLATALTMQPNRFFAINDLDSDHLDEMHEVIARARRESQTYAELNERVVEARAKHTPLPDPTANIYYRTYQVSDGFIAVGCLSAALRRKFCHAMGIDDPRYGGDPEIGPGTEKGKAIGRSLAAVVEVKMREKPTAEWLAYLDKCGVPSGPVLFPEELLDDEQVGENGLLVNVEHQTLGSLTMAGPVISMSATPLEAQSAPPVLGADNDAILASLGYDCDEIEHLRSQGVVR